MSFVLVLVITASFQGLGMADSINDNVCRTDACRKTAERVKSVSKLHPYFYSFSNYCLISNYALQSLKQEKMWVNVNLFSFHLRNLSCF